MRAFGVALVLLAVLVLAGASTSAEAPVTLRLDSVPVRPELALTDAQRSLGLMYRRRAPADGMLFVYPADTTTAFWMKNTLVPLAIVFFDARGTRIARFVMSPCRAEPCRTYSPDRPYRFALELRARDPRRAVKLGPLAALRRLTARAR